MDKEQRLRELEELKMRLQAFSTKPKKVQHECRYRTNPEFAERCRRKAAERYRDDPEYREKTKIRSRLRYRMKLLQEQQSTA